jgi:hypothetical protein
MKIWNLVLLLSAVAISHFSQAQSPFEEIVMSENLGSELFHFYFTDDNTIFAKNRYRTYRNEGPIFVRTYGSNKWETTGSVGDRCFSPETFSTFLSAQTMATFCLQTDQFQVSVDSGKTFKSYDAPVQLEAIEGVHHIDGMIVLATHRGTFLSKDTFKTFTQTKNKAVVGDRLAYKNGDHVILLSYYGYATNIREAFYSETFDGGLSWESYRYNKFPDSINIRFRHLDDSIVYVASSNTGKVHWSYDRTKTFDETIYGPKTDASTLLDAAFSTRSIGYALMNDQVLFKTYDGGKTWTAKDTFEYYVNTIELFGKNNIAVYQGYNGGNNQTYPLYVSFNGGEPTSTKEIQVTEQRLQLFPNPSNGIITISLDNYENEKAVLNIFSSTGQLVYTTKTNNLNNETINLSGNKAGVYFVTVQIKGSIYKSKIMIE